MRTTVLTALVAAGAAAVTCPAPAQTAPLAQHVVAIALDSGPVTNATAARGAVYSAVARAPGAPWLRLLFAEASLGAAPPGGKPTQLVLTSLRDGAVQHLDVTALAQWRLTSAYFNGDAVRLEIVADPGAAASRLVMREAIAGIDTRDGGGGGGIASICGPTDDRTLSSDPRAGRALPVGCTAWLIDDAQNCFLTAGHCSGTSLDTVEFNVPLSDGAGNIVHPGPDDQYAVDNASIQSINGGIGNDWGYFGCFPNTQTGLTAGVAQGQTYVLAAAAPPNSGQSIRITGYGVDSSPAQWNQVQQTEAGPYMAQSGTTVQYQTDTEGGNSGSAVQDESTGLAIGIHTHGGCSAGGGQNSGTAIHHGGLQAALSNPQGVCLPAADLAFTYPDGLPAMIDPGGDSFGVVVSGQNGGVPAPGTGMLHYDAGGGFIAVAMQDVAPNVYDAVFPALRCGDTVAYYVSAETDDGDVVNDPITAPATSQTALVASAISDVFTDDFEADMHWTVSNSPGLPTGQWQRGVPLGGGDRGDPPTDADGSGQCYVTHNIDGDFDIDGGSTTLTSPVLDATQGTPVVTYWRWFSNTFGASPFQDIFVVEVSANGGGTWTNLETVGPSGNQVDGGWFEVSHFVEDVIPATDQFRIRFTASDVDPGSVVEAGVDGVRLRALECGEACPWDLDGSGAVGINDLLELLAAWGAPWGIKDLLALLAAWGAC